MPDYSANPLVSLEEAQVYCRVDSGIDDELLQSLVLAATGACCHHCGREDLTEGATDDGLYPAITGAQEAQIKLWILAQVAYWYANRESAGAKHEIQPAFHYLLDSVRTYA